VAWLSEGPTYINAVVHIKLYEYLYSRQLINKNDWQKRTRFPETNLALSRWRELLAWILVTAKSSFDTLKDVCLKAPTHLSYH
jgi:hypothetical protein